MAALPFGTLVEGASHTAGGAAGQGQLADGKVPSTQYRGGNPADFVLGTEYCVLGTLFLRRLPPPGTVSELPSQRSPPCAGGKPCSTRRAGADSPPSSTRSPSASSACGPKPARPS